MAAIGCKFDRHRMEVRQPSDGWVVGIGWEACCLRMAEGGLRMAEGRPSDGGARTIWMAATQPSRWKRDGHPDGSAPSSEDDFRFFRFFAPREGRDVSHTKAQGPLRTKKRDSFPLAKAAKSQSNLSHAIRQWPDAASAKYRQARQEVKKIIMTREGRVTMRGYTPHQDRFSSFIFFVAFVVLTPSSC